MNTWQWAGPVWERGGAVFNALRCFEEKAHFQSCVFLHSVLHQVPPSLGWFSGRTATAPEPWRAEHNFQTAIRSDSEHPAARLMRAGGGGEGGG